jgi:hypothetical protein
MLASESFNMAAVSVIAPILMFLTPVIYGQCATGTHSAACNCPPLPSLSE